MMRGSRHEVEEVLKMRLIRSANPGLSIVITIRMRSSNGRDSCRPHYFPQNRLFLFE